MFNHVLGAFIAATVPRRNRAYTGAYKHLDHDIGRREVPAWFGLTTRVESHCRRCGTAGDMALLGVYPCPVPLKSDT